MEYRPTNREKRKRPRKAQFWCMRCDMSFLGKNIRCKVCGGIDRDGRYRYSKSQNMKGEDQ